MCVCVCVCACVCQTVCAWIRLGLVCVEIHKIINHMT